MTLSSPGKQLFETDHNLDTSDIQFLEDGKQSFCLGQIVKIISSVWFYFCVSNAALSLNSPLSSSAAGNNVEVDESLFQDIEDLDLDEDDPDFDPLEMGSDED